MTSRRGRPNASKAIEKQTQALGLDKFQYSAFTLDQVENIAQPISEDIVQRTLRRQQEADAARKDRKPIPATPPPPQPPIPVVMEHKEEEIEEQDDETVLSTKSLHASCLAVVDDDDEEPPTEPAPSPDEPVVKSQKRRKRVEPKRSKKSAEPAVVQQPPAQQPTAPHQLTTLLDLPGGNRANTNLSHFVYIGNETAKRGKKRKRQTLEDIDPFMAAGMSQLPKPKRRAPANRQADGTARPKATMSDENKANVHRARNNHRLKYNFHKMQHRHRLAKKAWLITQNQPPFDWTMCASEMPTTAAAWLRAVHLSLDSLIKDLGGAIEQFNVLMTQGMT